MDYDIIKLVSCFGVFGRAPSAPRDVCGVWIIDLYTRFYSFGVFGQARSAPKVTFVSTSGVFRRALSAPREAC